MTDNKDYLAVVAIDLGTSYSGYAFQTRTDFINNPNRIHVPHWYYGDTSLVMNKTITSILFRPDKEFDSFGYEAERTFADLFGENAETGSESSVCQENQEQGDPKQWYFFRHFKMQLYEEERISKRMKLRDCFGKPMNAMKVFSAAIQFMKDKAWKEFKPALGDGMRETDFKWVLTVPAIWGDKAKQFMRMAAEMAGIPHSQLVLALEPEVAAFFCKEYKQTVDVVYNRESEEAVSSSKGDRQKQNVDGAYNHNTLELKPFDEGCSFLVVDCGGGTVDITTFCIQDGVMKELQQASGGDVGGEIVTQNFLQIWNDVLGEEKMAEIQSKYPTEILDFQNSFQLLKQTLKRKKDAVSISLPFCISETIEDGSLLKKRYKIQSKRGKAIIPTSVILELFEDPIRRIVQHVESQLKDKRAKDVVNILMVGGFSDCSLLYEKITEVFERYRIIRPIECNLAVLKGAVMYGFKPNSICERIARFSYGICSSEPFQKAKHNTSECEKHRTNVDGQERIEDVFCIFIQNGETVVPGKTFVTKKCRMMNSTGQDQIDVYISKNKTAPMFVNSDMHECKKLGTVQIHSSDRKMRDRFYDVIMSFGYTELRVMVIDQETKQEVEAALNLLG